MGSGHRSTGTAGGNSKPLKTNNSNYKRPRVADHRVAENANLNLTNDFIASMECNSEGRRFFVPIGNNGLMGALEELERQLVGSGRRRILSHKEPAAWGTHEVAPGRLGLINHGGNPKFVTKPGRYPSFPFRNWWARTWNGSSGLSDTVIEFQGITMVQVSQNQAAVISDPQNQIFVIRNSGFVAFAIEGTYDVLSVVDLTHLSTAVKDPTTKATLGWTQDVKMKSRVSSGMEEEYVVATFLNVPANNCAILQRGDDIRFLGAGQSVITNPSVTLRGLYTLGENQIEMPTKDIFTRDQVPVSLKIYLKWQLSEPLKLTKHGYKTPYDALRDKAQSILTQIVTHLDYSAMVKQRSFGRDDTESSKDPSSAFVDALRSRAMDELHEAALEYGIVLKDLAVIDRRFKGEIATAMNKLTKRALEAQVEAANVDRENSNKLKREEGAFSVLKIKLKTYNGQANLDALTTVKAAKAHAERVQIEARAEAEATRLAAEAEAEAVRLTARADASVHDQFAREMQMRRMDVQEVEAYGSKAVFVPAE